MSKRYEITSSELREHLAENMKERVYATITLVAVITAIWQTADHHSVGGALAGIGGTAVALWLATLIAARVSHRAVYRKSMTTNNLVKLLFTSSGLFIPAIMPMLLVLVSMTGVLSLKDALFAGMITLLLSLFTLSFIAGRRIYTSMSRVIVISLLEMSVGVGVIALKLIVGE
jgi:VIT1/CCC1 family predicted Fe2+/Mn2+ transporter